MKREAEMDRQKRIQNTRKMIEDWTNELKNTENAENIQPLMNSLSANLRQLEEEKANIDGELNDLRRERENLLKERKGKGAKVYFCHSYNLFAKLWILASTKHFCLNVFNI